MRYTIFGGSFPFNSYKGLRRQYLRLRNLLYGGPPPHHPTLQQPSLGLDIHTLSHVNYTRFHKFPFEPLRNLRVWFILASFYGRVYPLCLITEFPIRSDLEYKFFLSPTCWAAAIMLAFNRRFIYFFSVCSWGIVAVSTISI